MTPQEAKRLVLSRYPDAWCWRKPKQYATAVTSDQWCVYPSKDSPTDRPGLGCASLNSEDEAWVFAAEKVKG